ncbi:hypothetical protein FG386_001248 [Cryptosporidium ryanae]|uniref:uncharacterized protein n=1 Tax=Cryptosporidium ryanae TaxID=515981 RepID=UPI00351AABF3|nr:hypothetical protein FG386_001248 [Cryptosporidium ryanae]
MLQSSGKLRKSIRVEPSLYQAWVPPFFSKENDEDKLNISSRVGECIYEPNILRNKESGKRAEDTIKNLKYLMRSMETDFNCLSGEKLIGYISTNFPSESFSLQEGISAEKLLLSTINNGSKQNDYKSNKQREFTRKELKINEFFLSLGSNDSQKLLSNESQTSKDEMEYRGLEKNSNCYPVSYGKYWEITLNQQIFLSFVDSWRKEVSIILNESYKEGGYTLEEGQELLFEGLIFQKQVILPELEALSQAVKKASNFERKVKEIFLIDNKELNLDLEEIKPANKIQIKQLHDLLKEGEECIFYSKCLTLLKFQLEKLKTWRKTVQSAIIEKSLDKCKDSMKDKDKIFIEVPGTDGLTEQIAASNWIEKVERSLSRPMRLNFAEGLLNEPAAKFLDERYVSVKKQLINRVNKALDWLNVVQSPPFVFNLVSACKGFPANDIPESIQIVIDNAKKLMESTNDWKLPKPSDFEKIWLESLTLKINVPISKYMEPVYLRWKKWHKKFKRLMDGLCIYMEAQLIIEEAEYTLCDFLDMSEYLPGLQAKINESSNWLNESKEFLRSVSEYNTKQDIEDVSSSVWNTITGIKKGNEFTKQELQEVIHFIESQIGNRLSYNKLKQLIDKGNELTIYDTSILQELSSCLDSCERWLKKGKELNKCSRSSNSNVSSIISLLLERSSILVSSETEECLFAELYFLLWKLDIKEVQFPIDDTKLLSLIDKLNYFKSRINFCSYKPEFKDTLDLNMLDKSENEKKLYGLETEGRNKIENTIKEEIQNDIEINLLAPEQITFSHWEKLIQLGPILFIEKLEQIYKYWNFVASSYEQTKNGIECWNNLLDKLKFLPIKMNELERKTKIIIEEYDRISFLLSSGDKKLIASTGMEHPFSLLFSYESLVKLVADVEKIPVKIENWDRWLKHIEDINNSDKYTLKCFPYLSDSIDNCTDKNLGISQIEMDSVIKHIKLINENLISTSVWNITNFNVIFGELKYTGKLLDDLESCKKWMDEVKASENNLSRDLNYWKELLERGKNLNIVDHKFLSKFEFELNISTEWDEVYRSAILETTNKPIRTKKMKLSSKKIPYYFAKLLVETDYGIGERLNTFRDLKESVKSYINLREKGVKYLETCHNERTQSKFSELLNSRVGTHPLNEKSIINKIKNLYEFTNHLKEFQNECLKHPILIEFTNYIQEEILLRDLNQKLVNTLIMDEYQYLSSLLSNKTQDLLEPRVNDINEAIELINYIESNNLYLGGRLNLKTNSDFFLMEITDETEIKYNYSIDELKRIVFSEDYVLKRDIVFGNSFISEKYIDSKLFEQFKNSVEKAKQWLSIFNSLGYNVVNNSKTETFYNKVIPSDLIPKNFKSSLELLMEEYILKLEYDDKKGDNIDNSRFTFNLDWDKILDPYLNMDYNNIKRSSTLLNKLLEVFNPDLAKHQDSHQKNNNPSENYSFYNVSLLFNLLHHMREKKELIHCQGYGKENYEETNNMVKSMINEKYFMFLPADGGSDLKQLENILNPKLSDFKIEENNNLINSQLEDLNKFYQSSQKRVKRGKCILEERVNEENIDNILEIVRKIPIPTIDMSLLLLSFAIKNIKFYFTEIKNLVLTIELTLLWISLINNKFPTIFSANYEFEFDSNYLKCSSKTKVCDPEPEIWENSINFHVYDKKNESNIESLSVQGSYNLNHNNKDLGHKISLKEFVFLIEICDQMPIQTPFKTKLVINLINILKWTLHAREAILLLPKNTILRPWLHVEGVNEKIERNTKNCKILREILSDENKSEIKDEDIKRIMSDICSHENENHLNVDKSLEIDQQLIKKIPRPRGRPKRESIHSNKSEITSDEIYNNVCSEYKAFDKTSNNFPKSFYLWLKESEELLTHDFLFQPQNEDEKNIKNNIVLNEGAELKYGWLDGYFYWYNKDIANKTEINGSNDILIQKIGVIDPTSYPKKSVYNNKLIIDFIISIKVFVSIENTPADLCAICSTFNNIYSEKDMTNLDSHLSWISCDECNRLYHQECVLSNNQNRRGFTFSKSIYNEVPWKCPFCVLRSTTSSVQSETIISQLIRSNILLCHNNNKYIISQIQGKPEFHKQALFEKYGLQREVYSQEKLRELLFNSLSGPISYIQLYERNVIYNKFYLLNVWIHDFQNKFKWDAFENSTYDPSIFVIENQIEDPDFEEKTSSLTKVKNESLDLSETHFAENQNIDREKTSDILENMSTSRKGRIIKNKISVKEMLNPRISLIKAKKGKKKRLLIPIHSANRKIKKFNDSTSETNHNTVKVNFKTVFRGFNCENLIIDPDSIGRLRKLEYENEDLDINGMINLYLLGISIGVDQIVEMEWLYCILRYLVFFNKKFYNFSRNLESLKIVNLPKDLTFCDSLKLEKRLKWDEFKYIFKFYSPNFPIKLSSAKNFYSGILSIGSNYFNCNSILKQFNLYNNGFDPSNENAIIKTEGEYEGEVISINSENFKVNIETLLNNMVKSGVTFPEEEIICQLLRTYYLESMLSFIRKQISNFYNNQLNQKPTFFNIKNIYDNIQIWRKADSYLVDKYKIKFLPPEMNNIVTENGKVDGKTTRLQFFFTNCDLIKDIVGKCNEWSENYTQLRVNCEEFEIFVDLLKQGLNLPCIYPPVYSFGNVLASIESYEDFIDQVFRKFEKNSTPAQIDGSSIHKSKPGSIICSNQPSTPKLENIQVLQNIKKCLFEFPIQKKDLNLKIEKMENNVKKFIQDIKEEIPVIKQITSTESLISKLQLIKEEALLNVPIIVTNLPELRELLNSLPDFGSPHHNLLVRTQFLMSLQSPIAKLRKPLNPFPNISDSSTYSATNSNANLNETIVSETRKNSLGSIVDSNKTKTQLIESLIVNSSKSFASDKALIWQNAINKEANQVNHCYYKMKKNIRISTMWSFVKDFCCNISENTCRNPYTVDVDWCSIIRNIETESDSSRVNSSKISKSTEIQSKPCMNSTDINELVNCFIKSALNGVSISIYDQLSQKFISGKYFVNRNLSILTLKSPIHTIIIPFRAINTILNNSEFNYLYSNNKIVIDNNKAIIIIVFDSNTEKSDSIPLLFNDQNSASNFLLVIEILRYNEMNENICDNSRELVLGSIFQDYPGR